jgi:hypothetical protein
MARPVTGDDETIELAQIALTQATTLGELGKRKPYCCLWCTA